MTMVETGYFTKMARTFSQNWGVTVAVKGSRAFATDKNTITLPATADFLSGDAREAMEGMLDHETSHIRAEAEARAEGKRTPLEMRAFVRANETKVVFDLTNVFEDIRVDRGAAARWAGVATNLVACRRFCYEQIAKKLASGEELPALFLLGCGIIAQAHGEDDFAAKLPAATRVVLAKLADEVADSRKAVDAEDVLALSRRVAAKLAALAEKKPEPEPEPEPEPDGEKEEGDDEGTDGEKEEGDEEDAADEKSEAGDENDEPEGDDEKEGDDTDEGEKSDDASDDEGSDADEPATDGEKEEGDDEGTDGEKEEGDDAGDESDEKEGDDTDEGEKSDDASDDDTDEGEKSDDASDDEGSDADEPATDGEKEEGDEEDAADEKSEAGDENDEPEGDDEKADSDATESTEGEDSDPSDTSDESDSDEPTEGTSDENVDEIADAARAALEDKSPAPDFTSAAKKELVNEANAAACSDKARVLPHPNALKADRVVDCVPEAYRFEKIKTAAAGVVGGLSTRLAALLRAPGNVRFCDRDAGKIDVRALPSLLVGERRIFCEERKAASTNTAVSILIDQSGSMSGTPIFLAAQAAYALGEALARAGVPFEICGWDNTHAETYGLSAEDRAIFTRFEAQNFYVYKSFDAQWNRRAPTLGSCAAGGNNDDASAVLTAGARLSVRREARKILVVLSDGYPSHAGAPGHDTTAQLRGAIAKLDRAGIECAGIGICSRCVETFYKTNAVVNQIADLPTAALGVLRLLLVGKRG